MGKKTSHILHSKESRVKRGPFLLNLILGVQSEECRGKYSDDRTATARDSRLCSDINDAIASISAVKRDSTSDSSDDKDFECCVLLQERFEGPENENNTLNVRSSILRST